MVLTKHKVALVALLMLILTANALNIDDANSTQPNSTEPSSIWLIDGDNPIHVRLATNAHSRAKGLMFEPYILPDQGMLFIFDEPQMLTFWMKNTLIALDIRFYDAYGRLVTHYPYARPCTHEPCLLYASHYAAKYVLEQRADTKKSPAVQISSLLYYWH